jgi:hypothetical protein
MNIGAFMLRFLCIPLMFACTSESEKTQLEPTIEPTIPMYFQSKTRFQEMELTMIVRMEMLKSFLS